MKNTSSRILSSLFIIILFLHLFTTHHVSSTVIGNNYSLERPFNNTISAVYVFGDSTVDPGNNNCNINTIFKCNFPPYGKDFINRIPTGRFSNGRLVTDFLASYIGIKETIPAYLASNTEDMLTGVSFASAGTGIDPFTAKISHVISFEEQLNYFRACKSIIEEAIGTEEANLVISKAVFFISAGTNDFVVNYFGPTKSQSYQYTISSYQNLLFQNLQEIIQTLIEEGATKLAVVGLPPMGCLPLIMTTSNDLFGAMLRECKAYYNNIAINYNHQLKKLLKALGKRYPSTKIVYGNSYDSLNDMMLYPEKYGFEDVKAGCCGTGLIEGAFFCNPTTFICPDASKKMFWDSIHPSQATYSYLFEGFRPVVDTLLKE